VIVSFGELKCMKTYVANNVLEEVYAEVNCMGFEKADVMSEQKLCPTSP